MQVNRLHSLSELMLSGPDKGPTSISLKRSASQEADGSGEGQRVGEWIDQLQNLPEVRRDVVAEARVRYLKNEFNSGEAVAQTAAAILNR